MTVGVAGPDQYVRRVRPVGEAAAEARVYADVGEHPAGPQHPGGLPQHRRVARHVGVHHDRRDRRYGGVGDRQPLGVGPGGRQPAQTAAQHAGGQVDADRGPAQPADPVGVRAGAGADLQARARAGPEHLRHQPSYSSRSAGCAGRNVSSYQSAITSYGAVASAPSTGPRCRREGFAQGEMPYRSWARRRPPWPRPGSGSPPRRRWWPGTAHPPGTCGPGSGRLGRRRPEQADHLVLQADQLLRPRVGHRHALGEQLGQSTVDPGEPGPGQLGTPTVEVDAASTARDYGSRSA